MKTAHRRFSIRRPGGVTLTEILVVLAIIIILLSLLAPSVVKAFKAAQRLVGILLVAENDSLARSTTA